jgi:hypothetical protein
MSTIEDASGLIEAAVTSNDELKAHVEGAIEKFEQIITAVSGEVGGDGETVANAQTAVEKLQAAVEAIGSVGEQLTEAAEIASAIHGG